MSEQTGQPDRAGVTDHPQHRAGETEGVRADVERDGVLEMSVFDGKGNEVVSAVEVDEGGRTRQGTGRTSADAHADAKENAGDQGIGEGHGPIHHGKA